MRERAETARAELEGAKKKRADYYVKTMSRIGDKGAGHVKQEIQRLERLDKDPVTPENKKASMAERRNILAMFL